jgi:cytochrome d ubiquinol oxidase subunit I
MAISLGFHIIFAEIGIAMPLMMVLAEWRWRRTGNRAYLELAQRWAKGTAVLFAVGAVSGTVLSFELGLLWPGFMRYAGPLIGMPFSLEGFAFFLEAIFLGIYLYGWDRVGPRAHLAAGVVVAASGAASAVFVVLVNAWMNAPTGFTLDAAGGFATIDPVVAMQSPAAFQQALHMLLAARTPRLVWRWRACTRSCCCAAPHPISIGARSPWRCSSARPRAVLQPLSGDLSARVVARTQPVKLAALRVAMVDRARRAAPHRRMARRRARGDAVGAGDPVWPLPARVPRSVRRGERAAHGAAGRPATRSSGASRLQDDGRARERHGDRRAVGAVERVARSQWTEQRPLLRALVLVAPFGFIATEAGWIVTEVGRQPWVVQGLMRTASAVTPMPGSSCRWCSSPSSTGARRDRRRADRVARARDRTRRHMSAIEWACPKSSR